MTFERKARPSRHHARIIRSVLLRWLGRAWGMGYNIPPRTEIPRSFYCTNLNLHNLIVTLRFRFCSDQMFIILQTGVLLNGSTIDDRPFTGGTPLGVSLSLEWISIRAHSGSKSKYFMLSRATLKQAKIKNRSIHQGNRSLPPLFREESQDNVTCNRHNRLTLRSYGGKSVSFPLSTLIGSNFVLIAME